MTAAGAHEVHFPALLPREPYEVTGRWKEYGDGIFRLKDRKGADYLLAPTHEEVFTLLVKDLYSSLQGPAALDLPDPGQVPRRGAPARRPAARPRVHDEGRVLVRLHRRGPRRQLPGAARRLRAHLRAARPRVRDRAGRRRRDGRLAQRGVPAPDRRSARTPSCARPAATRPTSRRSRRWRRPRAPTSGLTPQEVLRHSGHPDDRDARRRRQRRSTRAPTAAPWTAADTLKNVVLALTPPRRHAASSSSSACPATATST